MQVCLLIKLFGPIDLCPNKSNCTLCSPYFNLAPGKQGRYDGELLLREDQLLSGIWKQKVIKIRKDIKSAFGEDVTSDVGLYINKSTDIRIGLGKQNPNARKGRERRGKKKSGNRT